MHEIEYVAPKTLDEAVRLMAEKGAGARALAGGTDLVVQLRGGRFPDVTRVVDVKGVPDLNQVVCSQAEGLTFGAAVPCYRLYEDHAIASLYPAIVDCASLIGSIQIQGRASVGGNLCNSTPSADTIPSLIVLGATCVIAGPNGVRQVTVDEFCTGPGRNVLQPGELLVSIKLPPKQPHTGAFFLRFIPRNEMDIAVVNAAASVVLDASGRTIRSAKIALGAVAPIPVVAKEAGDLLAGKPSTEESIEQAGEAAKAAAKPISDMRGTIEQRIHLVGVLTKRALRSAIARAREA